MFVHVSSSCPRTLRTCVFEWENAETTPCETRTCENACVRHEIRRRGNVCLGIELHCTARACSLKSTVYGVRIRVRVGGGGGQTYSLSSILHLLPPEQDERGSPGDTHPPQRGHALELLPSGGEGGGMRRVREEWMEDERIVWRDEDVVIVQKREIKEKENVRKR